MNMFAYTLDENDEQRHWSTIDQVFATLTLFYAIVFFIVVTVGYGQRSLLTDENFYLCIIFIILSIVFYALATEHLKTIKEYNCFESPEPENEEDYIAACRDELINYDIYHSNWHIYSTMTILFALQAIKKQLASI